MRKAGQAERVDSRHSTAAPHQRVRTRGGYGFAHRLRPLAEVRDLRNAHRSVPDNRLGGGDVLGKLTYRIRADVERHPPRLNRVRRHRLGLLARLDLACADEIDWQYELLAPLLLDLDGVTERGLFDQAGASRVTLRPEEGVG